MFYITLCLFDIFAECLSLESKLLNVISNALGLSGPDVLTLTIGSDIACGPNTPRPACRGYLHKRTQSGLFKGWRKRWFVLSHGCYLFYYRHKRDEGQRRALLAVKLEGAEVGPDISLGKPFVFRCRPQSGSRVYFLCATSNQEMKRYSTGRWNLLNQRHMHNSNLPPLAVKSPECLGLLHKYDTSKDTWLQHYCILKDGCLYLYSGIRATHAYGGIYLQGYVVREQPYGSKKSTIELKPLTEEFKAFYLCAENPKENNRWITAIKASIKKWLPLRSAFQEYMNRPSEETPM
uniref:PDZ and pleckstrin homology domains 1 n=1 Tax=Cyclopterus lumpus TaxID=8103 RepID=A0A8C2YZ06_CYCLU